MAWQTEARAELDAFINKEPVLVRISAAKRLREATEREARRADAPEVTRTHVESAARLAAVPA